MTNKQFVSLVEDAKNVSMVHLEKMTRREVFTVFMVIQSSSDHLTLTPRQCGKIVEIGNGLK